MSDKLEIPGSELNKENISSVLEGRGISEDTVSMLMDLLNKCEFAQYAPELADSGLEEAYRKALDVMNKLGTLKRK